MKKELSIIIVNYNKYQLTQKCIKSVISNINNNCYNFKNKTFKRKER